MVAKSGRNCEAQLLTTASSSCYYDIKALPCCLTALLFSFPSTGVHYKPPSEGEAVKSPSHKAPWYPASRHSCTLASLLSPVPLPPFLALPFPLHLSPSPSFHSTVGAMRLFPSPSLQSQGTRG